MATDTLPIQYGIMLSKEQLDFLVDDRQGFHRMKAFQTFVRMASLEPRKYSKPGFSVSLTVGQFAVSTVELASLWKCDRKTAMKVVQMFNRLGILSSETNNRTTVHTLLCVAAWYIDGVKEPLRNPHYVRQQFSSPSSNDTTLDSQRLPIVRKDSDSREEKSDDADDDDGLQFGEYPPDEPDFPSDVVFGDDGEVLTTSGDKPSGDGSTTETNKDSSFNDAPTAFADADGCKPFSNENVTHQCRGTATE